MVRLTRTARKTNKCLSRSFTGATCRHRKGHSWYPTSASFTRYRDISSLLFVAKRLPSFGPQLQVGEMEGMECDPPIGNCPPLPVIRWRMWLVGPSPESPTKNPALLSIVGDVEFLAKKRRKALARLHFRHIRYSVDNFSIHRAFAYLQDAWCRLRGPGGSSCRDSKL